MKNELCMAVGSEEAISDLYKFVMIRKWLNMAALQSKIICGLFLQSSLILTKFMASLKLLLKNKFDTS